MYFKVSTVEILTHKFAGKGNKNDQETVLGNSCLKRNVLSIKRKDDSNSEFIICLVCTHICCFGLY